MVKPQTSNIDKERIISAYYNNQNFLQLAHQLNIKKRTAHNIINIYKDNNRVESNHPSTKIWN